MITNGQYALLNKLYFVDITDRRLTLTCRVCGAGISYNPNTFSEYDYEQARRIFEQAHTRTYIRLINNNNNG